MHAKVLRKKNPLQLLILLKLLGHYGQFKQRESKEDTVVGGGGSKFKALFYSLPLLTQCLLFLTFVLFFMGSSLLYYLTHLLHQSPSLCIGTVSPFFPPFFILFYFLFSNI
ncbi:hypothetical protein ABFX02_14G318000 [Erythranthe guttata]